MKSRAFKTKKIQAFKTRQIMKFANQSTLVKHFKTVTFLDDKD